MSVIESRPGVDAIPSKSDTREVSTSTMLERPSVTADPLIGAGGEGTVPVLDEPVPVLEVLDAPVADSEEIKCR